MRPKLVSLGQMSALWFLLGALTVWGDASTPIPGTEGVRFEQRLGAQIPLDLPFISDTGAPVRLGDYFHRRPVLLVLDYYRCPNLCNIVLNSLVNSLQDLKANPGAQFEVVVVSIDPTDTPRVSAQKKLAYVDRYERPQTLDGWHFLTGAPQNIQALADAVGFHFVYDPTINQYNHPSGMIVLTPAGVTSRYFFGIEFPSHQIQAALNVAAARHVSSPVEDFVLLCCRYNPLQGRYGVVVMNLFRVAGFLTVALLAGFVVRSLAAESRAAKARPERAEDETLLATV